MLRKYHGSITWCVFVAVWQRIIEDQQVLRCVWHCLGSVSNSYKLSNVDYSKIAQKYVLCARSQAMLNWEVLGTKLCQLAEK